MISLAVFSLVLLLGKQETPAGRAMDSAILEALRWLARHQEPDGSWAGAGFASRCSGGEACTTGIHPRLGEESGGAGVTALSLLAFFAAGFEIGCSDEYGGIDFGKTMRRGLKALLALQQKDGSFAEARSSKPTYSHSIAVAVLAQAIRSSATRPSDELPVESLRASLQRAVELLVRGRKIGCGDCEKLGASTVRCGRCQGGGKCPNCKGTGHLHIKDCRICSGKALIGDHTRYCLECTEKATGRCGGCSGSGILNKNPCPACKTKAGVCAACGGLGRRGAAACSSCFRVRPKGLCLKCEGKGSLPCPSCRGTKKLGKQIRNGWRYSFDFGESDGSVTAWCLEALIAARDAGIPVDPNVIDGALGWVDDITMGGRVGYTYAGTLKVYIPDGNDNFQDNPALTAATLAARLKYGQKPAPMHQAGIDMVLQEVPSGDAMKRDYYYWYHGAAMASQVKKADVWKKALLQLLGSSQEKAGCARGSWLPDDRWSCVGGRVYATAINTVSLVRLKLPSAFRFEGK